MPPPRPRVRINRVHAPENDMHPSLPLRSKLLTHLHKHRSVPTSRPPTDRLTRLKQLIRILPSSSPHLPTLLTGHPPLETRVLTLEALRCHPIHTVLPPLSNTLPHLPDQHLAPILDRVTRLQTSFDPLSAARTERLARGLGLRISRGAYIKLILTSPSEEALLHAHACLAVGHTINTALLNALLQTGINPTRILAEFSRRGLKPNGATAQAVLNTIGLCDAIEPDTWAKIGGSVIAFVARDDAAKGVGLLDVALARGVRIEPTVYDAVTVACVRQGREEAALRVWREKRRAWMGGLGRRARTEIVRSGLVGIGDPRWDFVVEGVTERERVRLGKVSTSVREQTT